MLGYLAPRLSWAAPLALAFGCTLLTDEVPADSTPTPLDGADLMAGFEPAPVASGLSGVNAPSAPPDPGLAHGSPPAAATAPGTMTASDAKPGGAGFEPAQRPAGPLIGASQLATIVYAKPDTGSERLGYLRLGSLVPRDEAPTRGPGCKGHLYGIRPAGYVCTEQATLEVDGPLMRAASRRPDLSKPLPYQYGFVRATAPQYLRIPTAAEQEQSEFKLAEHLAWYEENRLGVQRVALGANDVPLDPRGIARFGLPLPEDRPLSIQQDITELLGGKPAEGQVPEWLRSGRGIANVSGYDVPEYALFADRVRRKTGLSLVDAFVVTDEASGSKRRFAVTVDLRLVPATKIKPDTASMFHGVELDQALSMPFAIVAKEGAHTWKLIRGQDQAKPDSPIPRRAIVPLGPKVRIKEGRRFYQLAREPKRWLVASEIGVFSEPTLWPEAALQSEKWIDVSLVQQTLVLYEGKTPIYATLVSTGRDRLGDPKTSHATPRGTFRLKSKHIAAAMDSEENSAVAGGTRATAPTLSLTDEDRNTVERVLGLQRQGKSMSEEDKRRLANVEKGRHPEYGVTRRRGQSNFELRDVPWIQYFAAGYALHGAYWHDVFGTPRSHGCINLSPIDARFVFLWTTPQVPEGWHGINISDAFGLGTTVHVRE